MRNPLRTNSRMVTGLSSYSSSCKTLSLSLSLSLSLFMSEVESVEAQKQIRVSASRPRSHRHRRPPDAVLPARVILQLLRTARTEWAVIVRFCCVSQVIFHVCRECSLISKVLFRSSHIGVLPKRMGGASDLGSIMGCSAEVC